MQILSPTRFYRTDLLNSKQKEVQELAFNDFESFIRLVAPYQILGHCHIELCKWITKSLGENKLILWPRDHGKSRYSAFYAAWSIVRDPATTIIYASATAEKAEEQLRFIKGILTSPTVRKYFPDLVNEKEGQRALWNNTAIIVDHPHRQEEGVVDSTIMTCGLEKNITGKHCHKLILDDVVVHSNSVKAGEEGRKTVNMWVAQAASIASAESEIFAVGTRYHPKDAYAMMIDMKYDMSENSDDAKHLFQVNQADVEAEGQFLWPRMERKDGKKFGFDEIILAKKKAIYEAAGEITQFYAQYYNDPNDKSTAPIARELFKYYDRKDLVYSSFDGWYMGGKLLYLTAAVDLAATDTETSDYTVITVGGIDEDGNRYFIDGSRFRTNKTSKIKEEILSLYGKYKFKHLAIEAVSGFRLVAEDLKDSLYSDGVRIPMDVYIPPNTQSKTARINGILEPLYQSASVYHFRGGICQTLEDELVSVNPSHDDTKDAWALNNSIMKKPLSNRRKTHNTNVIKFNQRFGGVQA